MTTKCFCQHCKTPLEFEAEDAGRRADCPACGMETELTIRVQPPPEVRLMPKKGFFQYQKTGAVLQFQNPENGYIEEISDAPLWVFLLGFFYFAVKGVWNHAVASLLAALCTFGLSWLVYPFFANQIMRTHYLRKGWILISESGKSR